MCMERTTNSLVSNQGIGFSTSIFRRKNETHETGQTCSAAPTSIPHIWATNHSNSASDSCRGLEGTGCRQPIGSTFPTSHAPFPFALDVAVSSNAVKVRFVEVSSPSRNLTDIMFCYAESHRTSVRSSAIHCASGRVINRPTTNLSLIVVARFIGRRGATINRRTTRL